jgi:Dihydroorotase and related cyclic amidohydrolases
MIDPHVHLRDFDAKDKETILHGLAVAAEAGFDRVFDMPNTSPAVTDEETLSRRLALAEAAEEKTGVKYHTYFGLTSDERQLENAVRLYFEYYPRVIGLKLFAGQSTGNMGIIARIDQDKVLRVLSENGYRGVLAVHAEKESLMHKELYIPGCFETHSDARPAEAEAESIRDIAESALKAGFKGNLHFCHVSAKCGYEAALEAKKDLSVSLGVTPHHALFNREDAKDGSRFLKMNPPLRSEEDRRFLFEALKTGEVDFVESDHAPHLLSDKEKGMSGIPGFKGMALLLERLRREGVSEERLYALFAGNAARLFGLEEKRSPLPGFTREKLDLLGLCYPFDSYYDLY